MFHPRSRLSPLVASLALLLLPLCTVAQSALRTDFPDDATPSSADALRARISGKVFHVALADGSSWRIAYKANGYAFLDVSGGFRDTGTWRVEDGRLCSEWRKATGGCGEARLKGDSFYLKRTSNGEVVLFQVE
ncbi:MAG: hypothetical protein M3Y55_14575 [Pseudomonadota bacterium]|nr:hypothetical protein [Pseudomonadota bacterium]